MGTAPPLPEHLLEHPKRLCPEAQVLKLYQVESLSSVVTAFKTYYIYEYFVMPHFNGPTTLNLGNAFVKMITELKMNHQSNRERKSRLYLA